MNSFVTKRKWIPFSTKQENRTPDQSNNKKNNDAISIEDPISLESPRNESSGTDNTVMSIIPKKEFEDDKESIARLIVECSNIAIENPTEDTAFLSALSELADKLRTIFKSEYCAIGKITKDYVEDCMASFEEAEEPSQRETQKNNLNTVKRVRIDDETLVCRALSSDEIITYYPTDEINQAPNAKVYLNNLNSKQLKDTTIFIIQDNQKNNQGYIQFINSNEKIEPTVFKSFHDELLRLILVIKQRDVAKESQLVANDLRFFLDLQDNIHDVDRLLDEIMRYLSEKFHAGIITFRIPILVGAKRTPKFILRRYFIMDKVSSEAVKDYYGKHLIRDASEMGGLTDLKCKNTKIIIEASPKDDTPHNLCSGENLFHEKSILIPVLRDYSKSGECAKNDNKKDPKTCDLDNCSERFKKYFGVFRLRILKTAIDSGSGEEWPWKETIDRLSYLAKYISMILNSISDKYETNSLEEFKERLRNTSFIKISEYDKLCTEIIKHTIGAKSCSIYRKYDEHLVLSATTTKNHLFALSTTKPIDIDDFFPKTIENCRNPFSIQDNTSDIIENLFTQKKTIYYVADADTSNNALMLVPLLKNDNTRLGVMFLVGKVDNKKNISKTFWELDKEHIEFLSDILTRIEESDSERLTFLSQLSHELLRPITELVYRNELVTDTYNRNKNAYTKEMLILDLKRNLSLSQMFKNLISDVEYIYSLSNGQPPFNPQMTNVKELITQTIGLFETEAAGEKGISIIPELTQIPPRLYVDPERIMSAFINLIKNAIRYADNNSIITISYNFNETTECHEIDFADHGISVFEKDKDLIFNIFYRTQNAKDKVPSGTGIGLYLVKEIMKAHKGDCYVKQSNKPTIFTISIPNK